MLFRCFTGIVIPDEDENTVYNKVMAKLGQQNVTTV